MIFGESVKNPPPEGPVVGALTRPPRGRRGGRGRAQQLHDAGNALGLCPVSGTPAPASLAWRSRLSFAFALASSFALTFGDTADVPIKKNA